LDAEFRVSEPISETKRASGLRTPERCKATCSMVRPQLTPMVIGPWESLPRRKLAPALPTARRLIMPWAVVSEGLEAISSKPIRGVARQKSSP
jgi:hypothetical protein